MRDADSPRGPVFRGRGRGERHLALALSAAAVLICASVAGPASGAPAHPEPPRPELAQDTSDAVGIVNGFWERHWSDHFTDTYRPPDIFDTTGFYDLESSSSPPAKGM